MRLYICWSTNGSSSPRLPQGAPGSGRGGPRPGDREGQGPGAPARVPAVQGEAGGPRPNGIVLRPGTGARRRHRDQPAGRDRGVGTIPPRHTTDGLTEGDAADRAPVGQDGRHGAPRHPHRPCAAAAFALRARAAAPRTDPSPARVPGACRGRRPGHLRPGRSVARLEGRVADLLGKEAAVFMPTGAMATQVALRLHADARTCRTIGFHPGRTSRCTSARGTRSSTSCTGCCSATTTASSPLRTWRPSASPWPPCCSSCPSATSAGASRRGRSCSRRRPGCATRGIAAHLDGARLWEAQPYYGRPHAEIAALFDTVYVSLYKGLEGLAGAVLAGPSDFVDQAREWRDRLGGQLHHAWPLAVSAEIGLDTLVPRMPAFWQRAQGARGGPAGPPGRRGRPRSPADAAVPRHRPRAARGAGGSTPAVRRAPGTRALPLPASHHVAAMQPVRGHGRRERHGRRSPRGASGPGGGHPGRGRLAAALSLAARSDPPSGARVPGDRSRGTASEGVQGPRGQGEPDRQEKAVEQVAVPDHGTESLGHDAHRSGQDAECRHACGHGAAPCHQGEHQDPGCGQDPGPGHRVRRGDDRVCGAGQAGALVGRGRRP